MRAAALLGITMLLGVQAEALERQFSLNPRVEIIRSKTEAQASRGFLGLKGALTSGDFSMSAEAFVETEREQVPSELRNQQDIVELQEAFFDYRFGSVFVRVGRQPIRWSQSWTLPSLDVFTGRRWNRLFFDPVPEQLTHPDGVLLTWAGQSSSVDLFTAIIPAPNKFPDPFPEEGQREVDPQVGFRFQTRFWGIDFSYLYKWTEILDTYGVAASYAFENAVLKTEGGVTDDGNGFGTLGLDVFIGDFSVLPQVTSFQHAVQTGDEIEIIGYLPVRYSWGKNGFDFQIYRNFKAYDTFAQIMYSRDWTDFFRFSLFAQKYEGRAGRLFGVYQQMTEGGVVGGIRMEINQAL